MYVVPLDQLQRLYGGDEPRCHRMEEHQTLLDRKELVKFVDLPFDARVIFLSHEWVGWSHPDPHGDQLATFLRVMQRLLNGEIQKVELNAYQAMIYKTNYAVHATQWKEILSTAYVWFDWASMPQVITSSSDILSVEEKEKLQRDNRNAVSSIPAYVEKADFVVIAAPGCLHTDRRDPKTNLRVKTCYRTYRGRGWCVLEVFASFLSRDKAHPCLLITSKEGDPEWAAPSDAQILAVGTSDFTCCQRNHIFNDKVVSCDRGKVLSILKKMIRSKALHMFSLHQKNVHSGIRPYCSSVTIH